MKKKESEYTFMLNPLNQIQSNIPKENNKISSLNLQKKDSMKETKTAEEYFWNKIIIKKDEE